MAQSTIKYMQSDKMQKRLMADLAEIISKKSKIPLMLTKGFILRSLLSWQEKTDLTIEDTETSLNSTPPERISQIKEILSIFHLQAQKIILESQEDDLNTAVQNAIMFYEENYAYL